MQRYQRAGEVQAALEAVQSAAIVGRRFDAERNVRAQNHDSAQCAHVRVRKGDFLLLVGTTKGAFLLKSNSQRTSGKLAVLIFTDTLFMRWL